jgi:hypothetical protein
VPDVSPMSREDQPLSTDGMFRWDGERWAPTGRKKRQSLLLVLAGGILALLLALFAVVYGPAIVSLVDAFS